MIKLKDPTKTKTWYAVKITNAGKVVYIGVVDKINFTGNVACRVFTFLAGGEKWECINEEPATQAEAEQVCREKLSEYFDEKGSYPKYNHEEFLIEFKKKYAEYKEGWHGPIEIKRDVIEDKVDDECTCGNYEYGHYDSNSNFIVDYVGRSDKELQRRMQHRLDPDDPQYNDYQKRGTSHVRFRYAEDVMAAVEIECLLYHFYGGKAKLINDDHPARPQGIVCPISLCKNHQ